MMYATRHPTKGTPILLLKLKGDPDRTLPIWIAEPEAQAIVRGVKGEETPRPMTHDLLINLLESANAKIQQVILSDRASLGAGPSPTWMRRPSRI